MFFDFSIRISDGKSEKQHSMLRTIIVHKTTYPKKANPLPTFIPRTELRIDVNSLALLKRIHIMFLKSTLRIMLYCIIDCRVGISFFKWSDYPFVILMYTRQSEKKQDLTAVLIVFRGFSLGKIHVYFAIKIRLGAHKPNTNNM